MVARSYVPDAGDLVWLTFDPQAGHEQRGRRPALILSPRAYNAKARLALACPITSHVKGYPFEVALPDDGKVTEALRGRAERQAVDLQKNYHIQCVHLRPPTISESACS